MKNYFLLVLVSFAINFNTQAQLAGTLNTNFSQDGWDDSVFGNDNGFEIKKTIIQPDGKILVCAEANFSNEGHQAVILRYNPDGTVDTSFGGGDGVVRSKDDSTIDLYSRAYGMALQNNEKIIIAGDQFYNTERIFRLNTNGSLDTSFGTAGVIDMERLNSEFIYHVAIQSDNKIIVCGKETLLINNVEEPYIFLWRFTENGTVDSSFGNAGVVSYNLNSWIGPGEYLSRINDLIVLPDDKILINHSFSVIPNSFVTLKKFNANGTTDDSFGTNGEATKSGIANEGNYKYSSSSVQQNGDIISTFTTRDEVNSNYTESIYRINSQGQLDNTFNINLSNTTTFPDVIKVISSGEKIYVFKKSIYDTTSFDEISCFDTNGNLVNTFGVNGIALINQNNIPTSNSAKAAISENGNIYLASTISNPSLGELFFMSNIIGFDSNLAANTNLMEDKINVFPNPTSGLISISNSQNSPIEKVEITDALGKTVLVTSENTTQIDLSEFANGIYILRLNSGNTVFQKKIIKH